MKRRAVPGEANANNIELWTNHRVMEWLKEINLSEYAPNLRGKVFFLTANVASAVQGIALSQTFLPLLNFFFFAFHHIINTNEY